MRRKSKLLFILATLLFVRIVSAQTFTVTIPPGNPPTDTVSLLYGVINGQEEARKPLGTYFGYERTAFIIPHSAIGHYGQISSISIFCDSASHPGDVPLNIYVREVVDSVFTRLTSVNQEEAGAILTYSNTIPASFFVKNKWITIPFTTFFTHSSYNKAVEFIFETNAALEGDSTGNELINGKFFTHYQPANTSYVSQYWNNDGTPQNNTLGVTLSPYCPNVQITIDSINKCSGTPNTDTILSTADTLCLNEWVVLSLSNNTVSTGLSYQCQSSTLGPISFTNIAGADSTTLLTNITDSLTKSGATTWYRCVVSCGNNIAYSTIKQITLRNYLNCYCTNLGGGCNDFGFGGTAIDSVAIPGTTLSTNGLTGCITNYTLYPYSGNTTATLNQGSSYHLYTRYNGDVCSSFWIDYNQNGVLETSEWKQICLQSPSIYDTATVNGVVTPQVDSLFITPFSVPANAAIGKTLLRIRTVAGGQTNDTLTTCTPFLSGETEDYYITITYPLGIEQYGIQNSEFKVYPNPAATVLNVECLMPTENGTIEVTDMLGNSIYRSTYSNQHNTIDVSNLTNGVYFIEMTTKRGVSIQKFIIAR